MVSQNFIFDETEEITQAIEAAAGIGSIIQAFKQVAIAKNYYNLYAAQRQFYYNTFQQGVELPLINMLAADSPYMLNYTGRIQTMTNVATGPYGGSSSDLVGWWARHGNMYGEAPDPLITEAQVDIPRIESDWANYLFRFEEYWYDVRNDLRWYKRMAVHNIGIKQGSAVTTSLHYALTNLTNQIGDLGSQLATYGNGAAKYAGYRRGLSDVRDFYGTGSDFSTAGSDVGVGMDLSTSTGWKGIPYMQPGQQ